MELRNGGASTSTIPRLMGKFEISLSLVRDVGGRPRLRCGPNDGEDDEVGLEPGPQ